MLRKSAIHICIKPFDIFTYSCVKRSVHQTKRLQRCCVPTEMKALDYDKSKLFKDLSLEMKIGGPISIAEYMQKVLTHPIQGYYMNRDVFGQKGDFITSPEISQLFGEIIGVWIINEWSKISNQRFNLVELGPGRGTLSRDILRVFKQLRLSDKTSLHLVEVSPALSELQAQLLCSTWVGTNSKTHKSTKDSKTHYRRGITRDGVQVFWYHNIEDVPKEFSVFVAHEFFDALPIQKYQKTIEGWREIMIDIDPTSSEKDTFRYVLAKTPSSLFYPSENEKRDHIEVSPKTTVTVDYMSSFLVQYGGFSLIVDYGHNGDKTDTFRAYRQHKQCNPLAEPGTADLTADVDFSAITKVALTQDRLISFGPVTQRNFLKQVGIDMRLEMLLKNATHSQKEQIQSGYDKITDEKEMGSCFKMLSLFPAVLKEHLEKWPVIGFQT